MLSLGLISFAVPLALTGFFALAVIWWLLRLKPPAPKKVPFPAVRILAKLTERRDNPALTPWWLLVLRLLLATLIILAAAQPLWNSSTWLSNQGPVYLIVDNDWSAARRWQTKQNMMLGLIDQAEREGRAMVVLETAHKNAAGETVALITPADARHLINGLQPKPWSAFRASAVERLLSAPFLEDVRPGDVIWFSNGLNGSDDDLSSLAQRLQRIGAVSIVADRAANLPVLLRSPEFSNGQMDIKVERIAPLGSRSTAVRAIDGDGRTLIRQPVLFNSGETAAGASIRLPAEIYNRITRLEIEDGGTVGGVVLLDERWRRRPVGVQSTSVSGNVQPLLTAAHYLEKALAPFSEVHKGTVTDLLQLPLSVIAISDSSALGEADIAALTSWADTGGTVVHFADPALSRPASAVDVLLPVKLRQGNRALGGAMSWSRPARLAPFPDNSPFAGLPVSNEIEVRRQVLAVPAADLAEKTWARLSDGTPLITASRKGQGWLVLIHTTASPDWSNLSISGLFVDMLRRIVDLSRGVVAGQNTVPLSPISIMDAFGHLQKPGGGAKAIPSSKFDGADISADHPPGFYGTKSARQAHNLSTKVQLPTAVDVLPGGVERHDYDEEQEYDLRAGLLMAALVLFLIDTVISLWLRGGTFFHRKILGAVIIAAFGLAPGDSRTEPLSFARENSLDTRLAYVLSGDAEIDTVSRLGLRGLTTVLAQRTAAELGPPQGVDPGVDDLSFFPLLYWPATDDINFSDGLSGERIRAYMKNGGTILFDTRAEGIGGGGNPRALRQFAENIGLPPLVPVSGNHVLARSFYLLKSFPGRWTGGTLWIERAGERVNDGVSPVIVGAHDWAAAWARDDGGRPLYPVVPGGEAQRELAYRFGINLVMYTLTGNYKADQVHLPAIMQRLGQ